MNTNPSSPFLPNFSWAVPVAFSDALGACQFSRGDTLYSSSFAYRKWDDEFYKLAQGLHAIKVLSPEAKPSPPSPGLFQSNWNSPTEVEFYKPVGQDGAKRLSTTQGRIYSLLWRGNTSVLDLTTSAPPIPFQANFLLKCLSGAESSVRQLILEEEPNAKYFFVLPHDVCSQLLEEKYQKLVYGLGRTRHISELGIPATRLPITEAEHLVPTLSLKAFVFLDEDEGVIKERLKDLLYVQTGNRKSKDDKFRLNAHGLFSSLIEAKSTAGKKKNKRLG